MYAYASSTARTTFVGAPNQSVNGPLRRSKSSDDSGPSARIRSSTCSATSWVIVEDALLLAAPRGPEPRVLVRRHEREALVHRLEDLPALVQAVAPGRVVIGNARVQDEVMASARDRNRVELQRAEPREELTHSIAAAGKRPGGRE